MYINLITIDLCPGQGGGGVDPSGTLEITSNGMYNVYSYASASVSVHPSNSLSETYTNNGSYNISGEFNGGNINVNVHPSSSLSVSYTQNGVYTVEGEFNGGEVTVNVPGEGKDYRNMKGVILGLEDLGWDTDSIGYANANIQHYSWEDSNYAVSQANKALYGVVDKDNKDNYKTDTDMVYVPKFDTSGVTNMSGYFRGFEKIVSVPLFDTSLVTNMSQMFYKDYLLVNVPLFDTSSVTDMSSMFNNCTSLVTIPAIDTSSVTSMRDMFYNCHKLISVPLFNTSSVKDMSGMFNNCTSLVTIPAIDTSSVTDIRYMFYNCTSLVTIPAIDASSVTDIKYMFYNCTSLVTISSIDISSATNTYQMFYGCTSLENITITGNINVSFDISTSTKLTSESVVSILQAMSRTGNNNQKTATFGNITIADPTGDIRNIISVCEEKGWIIAGLVIPTGDPVIHYTSKDGNIVTPKMISGYSIVSNVYENGQGTITFNKYPTTIWTNMYQGMRQLNTIEIPDEITTLEYACFADNCGITSITIPANVTRLDDYVFSGAGDLIEVIMESSRPPKGTANMFNGHNANLVIKVPADAVNTYKNAPGWSNYASIIVSV